MEKKKKEKDVIKEKFTEAAMINELDKKEKEKDEAVKINELEKKKMEKNEMKEKSTEAAKINELDKKDDDERKNFSDIFGYVDKKSLDIILNHVENELGAVDGKLLCCYVIIER